MSGFKEEKENFIWIIYNCISYLGNSDLRSKLKSISINQFLLDNWTTLLPYIYRQ